MNHTMNTMPLVHSENDNSEQEKWQWQEPGSAWKGVGLYHITLTIPDRQPLLGKLTIPDNDPTKAKVVRTAWGNALVNCLLGIPRYHPEVQVLKFCLMPDHLHAVPTCGALCLKASEPW